MGSVFSSSSQPGQNSKNYQSQESIINSNMNSFDAIFKNKNLKSDGSPIRTKQEIAKTYDESYLPYPINNFYNLDYCWKVTKMMLMHSFFMALPCSLFYTIATDKEIDFISKNIHLWPFRRILKNYFGALAIINLFIHSHSLLTVNYCDRHSPIYNPSQRSSQVIANLIHEENSNERKRRGMSQKK
ncbi:unnamed protein product [Moneuplotes crassus]|uniref:Uncharacterized protein n=1 Tax=Euplotes crassus TaxID=5936 RepID=A0AAD1XYM8_EUPCR|nr:unnamed protein product [Moneuplotes crassus]